MRDKDMPDLGFRLEDCLDGTWNFKEMSAKEQQAVELLSLPIQGYG